MPRAYPLQPSLNAGEFSPRMAARTDFAKYPLACATLENMLPLPQGGAARRPGTRFVAAVKDHARKVKLRAFEFSTVQAYVLECGHEYIRFYKDRGRIAAAATDAAVANGGFDAGISGWNDISTGAGAIAHDAAEGRLNLVGGASGEAAAEQAVITTAIGQEHVVRFRVPGLAGQSAILRIGTSSGGAEILAARDCAAGWHAVAFTPTASPFYLQFANGANRTMQIDDVALISDAPVEIGAPWQEGELHTVKQAQSADVLYLTHPDRPVHKLSRTGHASWSLVEVFAEDGPYLRQNATATTPTPSATTGNAITISASATAGINGGAGFTDDDVGRLVRISNPASGTRWGYAVITGHSSATQVTAEVRRGFATANATVDWRLGAWCGNCGWPAAVTFQEQRLCFAGTREQPQTFWMSQSADFENMTPDSANEFGVWDGTLEDDDALDFTISADQVNAIRWIAPGKKLFVGTIGGEWAVSSESAAITPTDVDVKRQTAFGVADLPPVQMRSRMTFVQRAGRKVMEFSFDLEQDNFHALDMTVLSDHVTEGGIVDLAYQQEPDSTLWTVRADGQLPTLTYQPDQNVIGWARCRLGGAFGGVPHGKCETVAVIPAEGRDETWVCAARTVGGATRRYVEVFDPPYRSGDAQANACYADSALVYEGAPATEIVGLDHLEGETVVVLADGAVHPAKTVSGGGIVLDYPASKAVCGLPYTHAYESLKWEAGAAGGTAQGQIKRIHGVTLVLLDSIGGAIGPDAAHMKAMPFRATGDAMDVAVPLFTGEKYVSFDGDFATDTRVRIEGSDPAPFTLLAVAPEIKTNAR